MKTKTFKLLTILFVSMAIIWSCSKKDDNNATTNPTKIKTFTSGQTNNNFANGASNHIFTGNVINGNTPTGGDCVIGTWIVPKSSWSSCSQGYHLKLTFSDGGNGEAFHLDEYLCVTDQHKMFTWTHTSDSLFIVYDDETTSASPFVCSASQMLIYWNGNNPKYLIKQ